LQAHGTAIARSSRPEKDVERKLASGPTVFLHLAAATIFGAAADTTLAHLGAFAL
jgi:hypothetical protein